MAGRMRFGSHHSSHHFAAHTRNWQKTSGEPRPRGFPTLDPRRSSAPHFFLNVTHHWGLLSNGTKVANNCSTNLPYWHRSLRRSLVAIDPALHLDSGFGGGRGR